MSGIKAVINQLALHFRGIYPEMQVIEEFPNVNVSLKMPALSLTTTGQVDYVNMMPTLFKTQVNASNPAYNDGVYIVGQYNMNIQADLWCEFKNQRFTYFEKVVDGFNSQLINNDMPAGLSLVLANYYNAIARYDLTGYNYEDSEISSQRNEWRVLFNIAVTFPRLTAKVISLMEDITLNSDVIREDF